MNKREKLLEPIPPGEILLEEFMKPAGLSANKLAASLKVPANRVTAIIRNERSVTADTALRLSRYFGNSADFWINLQARYDLEVAKKSLPRIEREVRPGVA
jgi:addiction module HigA family antidote